MGFFYSLLDNSKMEIYLIQPIKSVVLEILKKLNCDPDGTKMPTVEKNYVCVNLPPGWLL